MVMKKVIILFAGLLIVANAVYSQGCILDGITFTAQEQIDNFHSDYPGCKQIGGYIKISGTDITNLIGLLGIVSTGGRLQILNNPSLATLAGLDSLQSIAGSLIIENNPLLQNLNGLHNLKTIANHMDINSNPSLISIAGLGNLVSVGGFLSIENNSSLTSIEGLDRLTSINSNVLINYNSSLKDLIGLESLSSIGGFFEISSNNNLTRIEGLQSLSSVGGDLQIKYNPTLSNLVGMESLVSVGGALFIGYNHSLTSITGLGKLKSVGGYFWVRNNDVLTTFSGLEGLTHIGTGPLIGAYELRIEENENLFSLTGLDNIKESTIDNLTIINNPKLSTCHIKSICDYLASPNGSTEISNNAPGCNSQQEVEEACEETSVSETEIMKRLSIVPNPANSVIRFESPCMSGGLINVFNANGKEMLTSKSEATTTSMDISVLPPGLYFVRLSNDKTVEVGKFVKK